jgi:hypothetical protein
MPALMGWLLTFLFVSASWVIFRAVNTLEGLYILQSMAGLNGFAVSPSIAKLLAGLHEPLAGLSSKTLLLPAETGWHLLFFSFVLFLIPNSCRIGGLIAEKKENEQPAGRIKNLLRQAARFFLRFQPNCYWALISGILFAMALYRLLRVAPTEFLYFNF